MRGADGAKKVKMGLFHESWEKQIPITLMADFITYLRKKRWYYVGRWRIKKAINRVKPNEKLKIILGAGGSSFDGWISTDLPHFDITKESDWKYFFSKRKADNLLADHVIEHIDKEAVPMVLRYARNSLKEGGVFRVAVPDAYNSDKIYIENVVNKGKHKEWGHDYLWNHTTLKNIAPEGFHCKLLEHFDEDGVFSFVDYSADNGVVIRNNKAFQVGKGIERSLIIDLITIL